MMQGYDAKFDIDPHADLPFERDFTSWLAGANLAKVFWQVEDPSLLAVHDDSITGSGKVARVYLRGQGRIGETRVICRFITNETPARKDERSYLFNVQDR